jgi:hypothetical protein
MHPYYNLAVYLWIAPHLLLLGVAFFMCRNGRYRQFPFFFTYVVFEILQFAALFAMGRSNAISLAVYTETDLLCRTGSLALHFGIIKELFESPLAEYPGLRKAVARPLHTASILFVVMASGLTALVYAGEWSATVIQPYVLEQIIDTAQCGLLVVFFAWHRFLGVWMKDTAFGIAIGMGLVTGLGPVLHALRYYVDPNSGVTNLVTGAGFHVSVLIWLYFTRAPERASKITGSYQSIDMREWSAELARFSRL